MLGREGQQIAITSLHIPRSAISTSTPPGVRPSGICPKLTQGSRLLFEHHRLYLVDTKQKASANVSPTSQGKQKALPACARAPAPQAAGSSGRALQRLLWPRPRVQPWNGRCLDLQDEPQGGEGASMGQAREACRASRSQSKTPIPTGSGRATGPDRKLKERSSL